MTSFSAKAIDRLADRVLQGKVVFFIGAGFSIDSEHNSTNRLMGRLLARFLAITQYLKDEPLILRAGEKRTKGMDVKERIKNRSADLMDGLKVTFELQGEIQEPARFMNHQNVRRLAQKYYQFNDWIVSAFGLLLVDLTSFKQQDKIIQSINRRENYFLSLLGNDPVNFNPIAFNDLMGLENHEDFGKALLLDTLGFADSGIMGGNPTAESYTEAAESYKGLLLPRHHVLARLAQEGLCPLLLTTNYDLLLEGAYRLSGMSEKKPLVDSPDYGQLPAYREEPLNLIPTKVPEFGRIASPTQFISYGAGHHAALLVKIHGCADNYRRARNNIEDWQAYLPSVIFTFREIQTWRADAWSRDLVRTLLRTRTIAFCGYSGVDPILHNTFREVYDEMAAYKERHPLSGDMHTTSPTTTPTEEIAPAFFVGIAGREEFHSLEILHASSKTVGARTVDLTSHPNLLGFHLSPAKFPNLDELLIWLYHRVYRKRQQDTLRTELPGIASLLLGHTCSQEELQEIRDNFNELCETEKELSKSWGRQPASDQQKLKWITNWTYHFHPLLMREVAIAQTLSQSPVPGNIHQNLRTIGWYQPIHDEPAWSAWMVVVELALRRMISVWRDCPNAWAHTSRRLQVATCSFPAITFARDESQPAPISLAIRQKRFAHKIGMESLPGAFKRDVCWAILQDSIPWRPVSESYKNFGREEEQIAGPNYRQWRGEYGITPPAEVIWRWASGYNYRKMNREKKLKKQMDRYLGVDGLVGENDGR